MGAAEELGVESDEWRASPAIDVALNPPPAAGGGGELASRWGVRFGGADVVSAPTRRGGDLPRRPGEVCCGGSLIDDLQSERTYRPMQVYCRSKLANVLFTYALARRLEGGGVTVNALHPGVVASGFGHNDGGWVKWGFTLIRPFLISPEAGAKTSLYVATSPEVEGISSSYFSRSRVRRSSRESYDTAVQERLWEVSEAQIASTRLP